MAIVLPYNLTGKTPAIAAQVMANFKALREALEGIGAASTASDIYQAGVLSSTDWVESLFVNGAGTGELEVAFPDSAAWLPAPGGGLVRTFTPGATTKLKPPALPAPGGFRKIGVELTASGSSALLSLVSGAEQASEAAAIANPPAISAGKVRVFDYVLQNSGGVYSTHEGRDRRPWARGAFYSGTSGAQVVKVGVQTVPGLTHRFEVGAATGALDIMLSNTSTSDSTFGTVYQVLVDGVAAGLSIGTLVQTAFNYNLAGGSHLISVRATGTEHEGHKESTVTCALLVREHVGQIADNGTA